MIKSAICVFDTIVYVHCSEKKNLHTGFIVHFPQKLTTFLADWCTKQCKRPLGLRAYCPDLYKTVPKGVKTLPIRPDIIQASILNVGSCNLWTQADKKTRVKGIPQEA